MQARLVHAGQELIDGQVVGLIPETSTLGFRWSAVNNFFMTAADLAEDEYRAKYDPDEDNALKKLQQFVWAMPHKPDSENAVELSWETIANRQHGLTQTVLPDDTQHVTIGFDSGKFMAWYLLLSWNSRHQARIVNYGSIPIPTNSMGLEMALLSTLHSFADELLNSDRLPDAVWYDSSFETELHYRFQRESQTTARFLQPIQGYGATQRNGEYVKPAKTTRTVRWIGEQMHNIFDREQGITRIDLCADYWKSRVHTGLTGPIDRPGSITLFKARSQEHLQLARHVLAEKKVEEYKAGQGIVTRWVRVQKANHLFDCLAYALAAGATLGHSAVQPIAAPAHKQPETVPLLEDGQPYFIWDRE